MEEKETFCDTFCATIFGGVGTTTGTSLSTGTSTVRAVCVDSTNADKITAITTIMQYVRIKEFAFKLASLFGVPRLQLYRFSVLQIY